MLRFRAAISAVLFGSICDFAVAETSPNFSGAFIKGATEGVAVDSQPPYEMANDPFGDESTDALFEKKGETSTAEKEIVSKTPSGSRGHTQHLPKDIGTATESQGRAKTFAEAAAAYEMQNRNAAKMLASDAEARAAELAVVERAKEDYRYLVENGAKVDQAEKLAVEDKVKVNDFKGGNQVVAQLEDKSKENLQLSSSEYQKLVAFSFNGSTAGPNGHIAGPVMGALVVTSMAADLRAKQAAESDRPIDTSRGAYDRTAGDLQQRVDSQKRPLGSDRVPTADQSFAVTKEFVSGARDILGVPLGVSTNLEKADIYNGVPLEGRAVVQSNMQQLVRNDLAGKPATADVMPLVKIVSNDSFQSYAQKKLGVEKTSKLNMSVAGAVVSTKGVSSMSTLALLKSMALGQYSGGGGVKRDVDEWVMMARQLTTESRARELRATGKPVDLWLKGRKDLEVWLATLSSLKSLDFLATVEPPFSMNLQSEVRKRESEALTLLQNLADMTVSSGTPDKTKEEMLGLKTHASNVLKEYAVTLTDLDSRVMVLMDAMRDETQRDAWRRYEKGSYLLYRRALGFLVYASRYQDMRRAHSALGSLVKAAFEELQNRERIAVARRKEGSLKNSAGKRSPASGGSESQALRFDDED